MKILIPNATGPTNIGDQAILKPLVSILNANFDCPEISVHSTEPGLYTDSNIKVKDTIYSWALFKNSNILVRLTRLLELAVMFLFLNFGLKVIFSRSLGKIIGDYEKSDLFVFVGGGYFRSKKGIRQSVNLLMTSFHFLLATKFKARKIVAPISFGPFAYIWQEKYLAWIINKMDTVASREDYSYKILRRDNIRNLIRLSDTALLLSPKNFKRKNNHKFVLGFTIRNWLSAEGDLKFQDEFKKSILKFCKGKEITIQPIIQVDAGKYGEHDLKISVKIRRELLKEKIDCLPIFMVKSLEDAGRVYSTIDMLLGMRMHSNILAAVYGTPFVAISYEHKTEGIAKDLGVEEYCIKVGDVTEKKLCDLLSKAYQNRVSLVGRLNKSIATIRKSEIKKWGEILKHNNNEYN